jgi:glycosyltransferase involved in cell wall biosynthesis
MSPRPPGGGSRDGGLLGRAGRASGATRERGRRMSPEVSIVVATRNRPALLDRLLASLDAARPGDFRRELVVVDNGSRPDLAAATADVVARVDGPARLVSEPRRGKSRALNTAIGVARGEMLAFLDDDVLARPGYLAGVRAALDQPYRVFGGRVLPVWPYPPARWVTGDGALQTSRGPVVVHDYGDRPLEYDRPMRRPIGCNFLIRREVLERVGGFDERLGPGAGDGSLMGGEESDLLARCQRDGERILYWPSIAVEHPVDPARMTKAYFRYRMFCSGRSAPYLARQSYASLFGAPRHLYLKIARALLQGGLALLRGRPITAFDRELDVCRYVGTVYEYRRLARAAAGRTAERGREARHA